MNSRTNTGDLNLPGTASLLWCCARTRFCVAWPQRTSLLAIKDPTINFMVEISHLICDDQKLFVTVRTKSATQSTGDFLLMCKSISVSDHLRASTTTLASATTRGPGPEEEVITVYSLAPPPSPESRRRHRAPLPPPAPPLRLFKQCLANDTCVSVTLASSVDKRGRMVRTGLRPLPPRAPTTSSGLDKRCTLLRLEAGEGGCHDTAIGVDCKPSSPSTGTSNNGNGNGNGNGCDSIGSPPPVIIGDSAGLLAGRMHCLGFGQVVDDAGRSSAAWACAAEAVCGVSWRTWPPPTADQRKLQHQRLHQ